MLATRLRALPRPRRTDGVGVWVDGGKKSAAEMREPIRESFVRWAETMPVRATHGFCIGTRRADGALRVTLMGTSYAEPVAVETELVTATPIASIRDVISGEQVSAQGRRARIVIPAGAFRLLDVRLASD